MLKLSVLRPAARVLAISTILGGAFAAGIPVGFYFYPDVFAGRNPEVDHPDDVHDADEPRHEDDHVALTPQAAANLDLRLGTPQRREYWKSTTVPAAVREMPGKSRLVVSAPVTGVIERVSVCPGETLRRKQQLFEIRITDESLTAAQSKLLSVLARQDVAQAEIERLAPLTDSGALSGVKKRKFEYELQQLQAERDALVQDLFGRGLPEPIVQDVVTRRQLAATVAVVAPEFVDDAEIHPSLPAGYSVERLNASPGATVQRGAPLCSVAFHAELYVEGTAFEADLPTLNRIAINDWPITIESPLPGAGEEVSDVSVKLLRVDSHVDEATQTVRFYAVLKNTIERDYEAAGCRFVQWRFRPGQRLHLRLPVERWENQFTLPADAVVVEGPNAMAFVEHQPEADRPEVDETSTMEHGAGVVEFEPVPVIVLHRDERTVVIADDGQLRSDDRIALNHAYKLRLAMMTQKMDGGHDHQHDH